MDDNRSDPLPPEAEIALAWSSPKVRGPLSMALQFDRRLARIVGRTTEPMLGQMRLAWWRDALGRPVNDRPRGDAVLDGLGTHWGGREGALVAMVNAWEVLVTAEQLGPDEIASFSAGRSAFFAGLADHDAPAADTARLATAGAVWALADAATSVSDESERNSIIAAGCAASRTAGAMPPGFRGLAVLEALSRRALERGGRPLMDGRGAPLVALRAAIFRI